MKLGSLTKFDIQINLSEDFSLRTRTRKGRILRTSSLNSCRDRSETGGNVGCPVRYVL